MNLYVIFILGVIKYMLFIWAHKCAHGIQRDKAVHVFAQPA